jgi:hypothetical protein
VLEAVSALLVHKKRNGGSGEKPFDWTLSSSGADMAGKRVVVTRPIERARAKFGAWDGEPDGNRVVNFIHRVVFGTLG